MTQRADRPVARSQHERAVRESFGQQVDAFSGRDSVYATQTGPTWAGPLKDSFVVLEVACGAAHAGESVAPFVHQVVGIDLTPGLLKAGAERLRDSGVTNVLLQEGNAEALPFVAASFDVVFCRSSLHHFAHPYRAIEQMVRVSRPGGRLVLIDLVPPSHVDRDRFDHLHRLLDRSHVRTFTEKELIGALPAGTTLASAQTSALRFPIDVAMNAESDRESVLAALEGELGGQTATGFEPAKEGDTIVVSFYTCVMHATVP
jgi:ubiquinone/menaquinone biosynthesis C-methylase UbiE